MDKISLSAPPSPVRHFDSPSADNANGYYQSYKVLKNDIAFSFLHSGEDGGCQVKTVFLKLDDFRAFLEKNLETQDREDYLNHVLRPCTDQGHSTVSTITPILTVARTLPDPSMSKPEAGSIGHTSETWQSTAHSAATIRAESSVAPSSDQKSTSLQEAGAINATPSFINESTIIPATLALPVTDIISPSEQMATVSSTEVSSKQPLTTPTPHSSVHLFSDSLKRKFTEFLTYKRDIHSGYQKKFEKKMDEFIQRYSEASVIPRMRELAPLDQLFDLTLLTHQLTADAVRLYAQGERIRTITLKPIDLKSKQRIHEANSEINVIEYRLDKKLRLQMVLTYYKSGKQMLRFLGSAKNDHAPQTTILYDKLKLFTQLSKTTFKWLSSEIMTINDTGVSKKISAYKILKSKLLTEIQPANLTAEKEVIIYTYAKRLIRIQAAMFERAIALMRMKKDYAEMERPDKPKDIISQSEKAANEFIIRWTNEPGRLHQMHNGSVTVRNEDQFPDNNSLSTSDENISKTDSSEKPIKLSNSTSEATTLKNELSNVSQEYRIDFIKNFREKSDHKSIPPTQAFVDMFSIHGMKMIHAINGLTHYLGRLVINVMDHTEPSSKERDDTIKKILLQKDNAYKAALNELKDMFFECIEIRKDSLKNQNQHVFCEGQFNNYSFLKDKLKNFFNHLTKSLKEYTSDRDSSIFNTTHLFEKISEINEKELSILEILLNFAKSQENTEGNSYTGSCITKNNNQTEQTRYSQLKVEERVVNEFSSIAMVCASLLSQIGFDLHFRLKDLDLQAYQDRPLLPFDFANLIDDQSRKRRDLSDTDDMGSTNEPIDDNHIVNEIADDDDNAALHLTNQPDPNHPLSSGASMHRGVWSAIGSQLVSLAQYIGLTNTANRPASLFELPRKVGEVNDSGAEPAEQASSFKPVSSLTNDSLILANIVASLLNDRPIRAVGHHDGRLDQQTSLTRDPLEQSPGMRLLEGSRGIASQLHTELSDFVQSLADDRVAEIAPYWQPEDLLNIAIVQMTGVDRTSPTNDFLQAVLASPELGVEHESPDNIFRSDGTVRKVAIGADGQPSIFYDSVTGKTTTGSPSVELARCMLQAMAQRQLKNRQLSKSFRQQVLDRVLPLQDRRSEIENSTLSAWLGLRRNDDKDFKHDFDRLLTEQVGKLRQPLPVSDGVQLNPLVQSLNMGNYQNTRHQFMNLAPDQQISMIRSLANAPDTLGLDQSSEFIAQWLRDIRKISSNDANKELPDWSAFAISQRAWQLFTYLYDCKVSASDEAFSRQQLALTISERQIAENDDETWRLNQVITDLLPAKSCASDRASIESGSVSNLLPPAQCHWFDDSKIDKMLDAYFAIKNQVKANFPRAFADTVSDPLLKQELTGLIATACLEALKGKLTANPDEWRTLVNAVINEEFVQFTERHHV